MIRQLIDGNKPSYKAALHVHTTISDGRMTPEEMRDAYYKAGYSVVAFTDHQVFVPHNDFTTDDFLAINSVEFAYSIGEPNPNGFNGLISAGSIVSALGHTSCMAFAPFLGPTKIRSVKTASTENEPFFCEIR